MMIPNKWKVGKRVLAPGLYEDANGALHVDLVEICIAAGYPPSPENIEACAKAWDAQARNMLLEKVINAD